MCVNLGGMSEEYFRHEGQVLLPRFSPTILGITAQRLGQSFRILGDECSWGV